MVCQYCLINTFTHTRPRWPTQCRGVVLPLTMLEIRRFHGGLILTREFHTWERRYLNWNGSQSSDAYVRHTATCTALNTLRPIQNGRHFADDTFKRIFLNENVRISIKISLKFVPKGPTNNIPALAQMMAWRRPVMVRSPTHICVARPQCVNQLRG